MIYLASRSPRRRELLGQIGVRFETVLLREQARRGPDVDETPHPAEAPAPYALRVACAKAEAAVHVLGRRNFASRPVLAADTTVVCGGAIIGKPSNGEDAARILTALSGREHEVVTAVAVAAAGRLEHAISTSRVWFRDIDPAEISRYVSTGESTDKAGAYAVQGRAAVFITRIEGSFSGIMGLPLAETAALLTRFGVEVL